MFAGFFFHKFMFILNDHDLVIQHQSGDIKNC